MQLFTPTLLATAALAAVARADSCDTTELATIIASSNVTTCTSDSGYDATSLVAPTDTELALMCSSTACQAVLSSLVSSFPDECTVSTFSLYADLITPVEEYCSAAASASASTDSTAASEASASASTSDAGDAAASTASGSAIDESAEVTVAPTTNSTSSASSDDDVVVGDSDSGSDFTIETSAPTTDSSAGEAQDEDASTSSASSAASEEASASGSSAGVAVGPSPVLLGSALAATAVLFL